MKFKIGDKILLAGIYAEVRYVNAGKAWVSPIEATDSFNGKEGLSVGVTFEILDSMGIDSQGNRAKLASRIE